MKSVATAAIAIVLGSGVCEAQNFGTPLEGSLRLEWEVTQSRSGRPTITGYIYNDRDFWATDLQLVVEELDSSGRPVGRTIAYFGSVLPPSERRYFEVPVPAAGVEYRVRVHSFDVFSLEAGP